MIVPQDENVFEGTFGKVRKVTIRGAASIPEWIEFAGKTDEGGEEQGEPVSC